MGPLNSLSLAEPWVYLIFVIEAVLIAALMLCFAYLKFKNTVLAAREKTEYAAIVQDLLKVILSPREFQGVTFSKKTNPKLIARAILELHGKVSLEIKNTLKHIYVWLGHLDVDHRSFNSRYKYNRLRAFLNAEVIASESSLPHFLRRFRQESDPLLKAACARAIIRLGYKGDLKLFFDSIISSRRFDSIVEVMSYLATNRMDVFRRLYSQVGGWEQKSQLKLCMLKVIIEDSHVEAVDLVTSELRQILADRRTIDPMIIKTMFLCLNLKPDSESVDLLEACRYYEDDEISFLALCALQKIRPDSKTAWGQFLVSNNKSEYLPLFEKHSAQVATLSHG